MLYILFFFNYIFGSLKSYHKIVPFSFIQSHFLGEVLYIQETFFFFKKKENPYSEFLGLVNKKILIRIILVFIAFQSSSWTLSICSSCSRKKEAFFVGHLSKITGFSLQNVPITKICNLYHDIIEDSFLILRIIVWDLNMGSFGLKC